MNISANRLFVNKCESVALATNERVISYIPSLGGYDLEEISYSKISAIDMKIGAFADEVELSTSGETIRIKKIIKGNTLEFIQYVRRHMSQLSEKVSREDVGGDTMKQIMQLAEMRDKGIVTDDEFQSKKKQLLERL